MAFLGKGTDLRKRILQSEKSLLLSLVSMSRMSPASQIFLQKKQQLPGWKYRSNTPTRSWSVQPVVGLILTGWMLSWRLVMSWAAGWIILPLMSILKVCSLKRVFSGQRIMGKMVAIILLLIF